MTTHQLTPEDTIYAVDDEGFMARCSRSYATKALLRGEVTKTAEPNVVKVVTRSVMRKLTGAERRAIELAKAKAKK